MLTPEGFYYNFSGCGNTFNCNNPVVRGFVVECLRHWVSEYHIDGFRFDLASILGRAPNGAPLSNPPLLESLAGDPILGRSSAMSHGNLHFSARTIADSGRKRLACFRRPLALDVGWPTMTLWSPPHANVTATTIDFAISFAPPATLSTPHDEAFHAPPRVAG
jgi:hypothetical protein